MTEKQLRKIDALVGEEIMGWKILSHWDAEGTIKHLIDENQCEVWPVCFKPYSTDIKAAWEVVEKIKKNYPNLEITHYKDQVEAQLIGIENELGNHPIHSATADADMTPLAICLAALKSKGIQVFE